MSLKIMALLLCLSALMACNRMADEELCEKAYQHMFELDHAGEPESVKKVKADQSADKHMEFLKACVGKETEDRMQCFLASESKQALQEECKRAK